MAVGAKRFVDALQDDPAILRAERAEVRVDQHRGVVLPMGDELPVIHESMVDVVAPFGRSFSRVFDRRIGRVEPGHVDVTVGEASGLQSRTASEIDDGVPGPQIQFVDQPVDLRVDPGGGPTGGAVRFVEVGFQQTLGGVRVRPELGPGSERRRTSIDRGQRREVEPSLANDLDANVVHADRSSDRTMNLRPGLARIDSEYPSPFPARPTR